MYSLVHFLSHLRRSQTDLVLDVGANTGQFALQLFNAGFTGRIISFEPLSSAHAALVKAARDNPKWEVAPRSALGAAVGTAMINIAGNSFSSSLRPMLNRHLATAPESAYIGTEIVPVETLAQFIAQRFPSGAPRFALKIDTQGFEAEVLDGLGAHVNECAAVLLEMPLDALYGGAADLPTLFARLVKCNLRCAGLSPGHKDPHTGDAIEVDGLFVRNVSAEGGDFPLFTSVPPHLSGAALTQQREAIASWRAAGFTPVSVNGPSEMAQLSTFGLDIEVQLTSEDGKPFIADIVAAIRERRCARAGIINAGCKMLGYPNLALTLAAALGNSALYAERIDIGDDRPPIVGECNGFDAFFFDVDILGTIDDRQFRLGETWWDYWFPLQLAANGAMLGNIDLPLIQHRRHEAHWNDEQWVRNARGLCAALQAWSGHRTLTSFLSSLDGIEYLKQPVLQDLSRIGAACFDWLRARKLPRKLLLLPDEMGDIEALLREGCRHFLECGELAAAKLELATLRASNSWRITAPLRRVANIVR